MSGFAVLKNLVLLDLEGNLIEESAFKKDDVTASDDLLPNSLQYLVLRENPIFSSPDYRLLVLGEAPLIIELDEKPVSILERKIALRISRYITFFSD